MSGGNGGSAAAVVSPLVAKSSAGGDNVDAKSTLSRQNSVASLHSPASVKPVSAVSVTPGTGAASSSRHTSSAVSSGGPSLSSSLETASGSVSFSHCSVGGESTSSPLSTKISTEAKAPVLKQHSSNATHLSISRQLSSSSSNVTSTTATTTVTKSTTTVTAGNLLSSGSVSTPSITPSQTGVPVTQRTSVSSAGGGGGIKTMNNAQVNKITVSGGSTSVKPLSNTSCLTKPSTVTSKPTQAAANPSKLSVGSREQRVTVSGSLTAMAKRSSGNSGTSAVAPVKSSVVPGNSTGLKAQGNISSVSASKCEPSVNSNSVSTSGATSCSASLSSSVVITAGGPSNKTVTLAAARGRKNSLSAILDKLNNRAAVSSTTDGVDSAGNAAPSSLTIVSKVSETAPKEGKRLDDVGDVRVSVKRSASLSGLSPLGPESKLQRLEQAAHKPAITVPSPTIPSPAHTPPPYTSPSFESAGSFSMERRWSGEREPNGEMGLDLSSKRETVLDLTISKDLTSLKEKAHPDYSSAPITVPPPRPDSRERISPKDVLAARCGSPSIGGDMKVTGGTKFNGESSKDKMRTEMDLFKVPTPLTPSCDEGDGGGAGRVTISPVCSTPAPPGPVSTPALASPQSDASSPGNDLIIDCGDIVNSRPPPVKAITPTPVILPSPKRVKELTNEGASSHASPNSFGKSSPSHNNRKNSPQISPHPKQLSSPSAQMPVSPAANDTEATSPYMLDDDLMDMALTG